MSKKCIIPRPRSADPEWLRLVRLEPRLLGLLDEARWVDPGDDTHFCANAVWFGYHGWRGLKPRLFGIVGWDAENPALCACRDYDIAYHTIYDALPSCRQCGCA